MRLIQDTRGLATVEAAVVLPVFIFIFAGLVYMHRLYSAKLETMVMARECAWAYSNGGCEALPPGCEVVDHGGDLLGMLTDEPEHHEKVSAMRGIEVGGDLLGGMMGLDSGFSTTASREYRAPSVYGGGTKSTSSNYSLLCNEKEKGFGDVMGDFYCYLGGDDAPGCPW